MTLSVHILLRYWLGHFMTLVGVITLVGFITLQKGTKIITFLGVITLSVNDSIIGFYKADHSPVDGGSGYSITSCVCHLYTLPKR